MAEVPRELQCRIDNCRLAPEGHRRHEIIEYVYYDMSVSMREVKVMIDTGYEQFSKIFIQYYSASTVLRYI